MNILIIARSFKPMTGGIAEYTHQIARHLQGAGDNVMVLSKKRSDDEKFDSTCSYIVKRYNYDSQNPGKLHWYYGMYKAIKEAIREHSPDFLINNLIGSATHRSGTHICWMFSRLLKIPYCIFTHGLEINKKPHLKKGFTRTLTAFKLKLKRTIALRGADRVFCNSSFTQGVVESFGIPHTKTAIINPGIAISDLEPSIGKLECSLTKRLKLRGKKVVLTLSRLVERKGIDMTIKAMEVVKENVPNVVYIIAGDGPYRDALEKMRKKLRLRDNVIFTGYVPEEEKDSYYKVADLFIMPNRELDNGDVEGFGIVFLEANAYEKPVIGGRSGGVIDAIVDGETGLLVNPMDADDIASAIIQLLKNEDYAKQLGKQGRKRAEVEFNWVEIVSKIRCELRQLK